MFFKQYLVYNGKLLGLTKYNEDVGDNDFDLEDDLVTLKSNKVVFNGKKVIECQVSDGINKADKLIERAMKGDAPEYKSDVKNDTCIRIQD